MYKWLDEIKQIIGEVLFSQDPIFCLEKYLNIPLAQNITFLLFDGNQTTNFKNIIYEYCNVKYSIVALGNYDNTAVVNTTILSERYDSVSLEVAYCIDIDSNIASMLPKILKDKPLDNDLFSFLEFIKTNNLNLNLLPYLLEDSLNTTGMSNEASVYECLLSFFIFKRFYLAELNSLPITPDTEDYLFADNAWSQMKYSRSHERNKEKRVRCIYCFLLKVYIIRFQTKRSPKNKISELIQFNNTELGVYFEAGMILAYWFYSKAHECVTEFFQKKQFNSKDKLKDIEGMAWDLFHLWDIPTEMAILSTQNKIMLPALGTHEDALAKISKLNPITRIAFYSNEAQVKYKFSIEDVLDDSSMLDSIYEYQSQREKICETINLLNLSTQLEQEFIGLFEKY